MRVLLPWLLVPVVLLATLTARRRPEHQQPPAIHQPRHAAPPPRQARAIPQRIPNYPAFAECAERHSALWEITYAYGSPCPYTARNRVTGHRVAVDDLDLLDHILATYEPPHPVRGYYGQQTRGRVRSYLNGEQ